MFDFAGHATIHVHPQYLVLLMKKKLGFIVRFVLEFACFDNSCLWQVKCIKVVYNVY